MTRTTWLLVGVAGSLAVAGASLRAMTSGPAAAPPRTAAVPVAAPAPAPARRHTPPPRTAPAAPTPVEQAPPAAVLERAVAAGAPDARLETEVHDALRGELFAGVTTRAVRCTGALCRIELEYPSDALRETVTAMLPHTAPFDTEGVIQQLEAPVRSVLYVARRGQPLPL